MCYIACKKPFEPAITAIDASYLVVEGVINSGNDSTFIKLSHTFKLDSTNSKVEVGARVLIESDKNDTYTLNEIKPGKYFIFGLNLSTDRNYRLHIFTTDNKEYTSDYVENKITPPIDTITYKPTQSGLLFYASAHDNANKTKYYRWDYDETWSYASRYVSWFVYKDQKVVPRTADSVLTTCYRFATPSNNSVVSSSVKLTNDVISNFPVGYVDAKTGKLSHVYSVNVKQYALTPGAFAYWQLLKKNTEQLGSIFDASPSQLIGNIHSVTNPKEIVIGYLSVSTITRKRIFIPGRSLPFYTTIKNPTDPPDDVCALKLMPLKPAETLDDRLYATFLSGDTLFADATFNNDTKEMIAYKYGPKICIDCRLLGGTIIKPSYWP
jgi:hypothetical protein